MTDPGPPDPRLPDPRLPDLRLPDDDPLAVTVTSALHHGDVPALRDLLAAHPDLATARIVSVGSRRGARTLLHVFADAPGHRPHAVDVVALLLAAGADIEAPMIGTTEETALHWAASNDDVDLIDALLDAGADIEAPGSPMGSGTPIADAVVYGQLKAAERLAQRGARTNLFQSAALGLLDRVHAELATEPDAEQRDAALWIACFNDQRATVDVLLDGGADPNRIGWDGRTALDVAAEHLVPRLREHGARSAAELG